MDLSDTTDFSYECETVDVIVQVKLPDGKTSEEHINIDASDNSTVAAVKVKEEMARLLYKVNPAEDPNLYEMVISGVGNSQTIMEPDSPISNYRVCLAHAIEVFLEIRRRSGKEREPNPAHLEMDMNVVMR